MKIITILFELRISLPVDTGIFVEPYIVNEKGKIIHFTLDARHLCYVLCNAARKYYENHELKSDFSEHQFSIVDVEASARKNVSGNSFYIKGNQKRQIVTI